MTVERVDSPVPRQNPRAAVGAEKTDGPTPYPCPCGGRGRRYVNMEHKRRFERQARRPKALPGMGRQRRARIELYGQDIRDAILDLARGWSCSPSEAARRCITKEIESRIEGGETPI